MSYFIRHSPFLLSFLDRRVFTVSLIYFSGVSHWRMDGLTIDREFASDDCGTCNKGLSRSSFDTLSQLKTQTIGESDVTKQRIFRKVRRGGPKRLVDLAPKVNSDVTKQHIFRQVRGDGPKRLVDLAPKVISSTQIRRVSRTVSWYYPRRKAHKHRVQLLPSNATILPKEEGAQAPSSLVA